MKINQAVCTLFKSSVIALALFSNGVIAKDNLPREVREPEAATGYEQKQGVIGSTYMAAAANPYASEAGRNVLAKGGSAIDAAIAIQMVLTLVEPQSSGIGGGAFLSRLGVLQKALGVWARRRVPPAAPTWRQ